VNRSLEQRLLTVADTDGSVERPRHRLGIRQPRHDLAFAAVVLADPGEREPIAAGQLLAEHPFDRQRRGHIDQPAANGTDDFSEVGGQLLG